MKAKTANFRSRWFTEREDFQGFVRAGLIKSMGYTDEDVKKPFIGIVNSWSELNPGHFHLRQVAEAVKRGVWQAGGFPLEFNTMSMCEVFFNLSTLPYRNLMSMVTEEMITRQPFDALVFLSTCDKNVPAQLMACASADIPSIFFLGGPMASGRYEGRSLACCTDGYAYWADYVEGKIDKGKAGEAIQACFPTIGACGMMGTANTMQSMAEALGMCLPGCASIPAVDVKKYHLAEETGRQVMRIFSEGLRPSHIMTREAFENAVRVLMAIGGSTNAVIHLIAIAKRLGIDLNLEDFDTLSRSTPHLCRVKPNGPFTVAEFAEAGGIPAVIKELEPLLHSKTFTVTGKTVAENLAKVQPGNREIIASRDEPVAKEGGIAILGGNLAPDGAVIKQSAASAHLLKHRGPALVFESYAEAEAAFEREDLDVTPENVIVVRNAGPVGGPGMPEAGAGTVPLPQKLVKKGIRDMVRITDARISGSAYGTIIVHISPEAAVRGPYAAIQTGDIISLDVPRRKLMVELSDREIARRLESWRAPQKRFERGYLSFFIENVTQAHEGCDFPFMY